MASVAQHTPFELSLLLTALLKHGADQSSFLRISAEFMRNDVILENPTYDATRITPDSLESVYLQILKQEVRAASQYHAQQTRKRKSPTPPLQTLEEARRHRHLLPGLAKRYHLEFVQKTIESIREDEDAYFEGLDEEEDTSSTQLQSDQQDGMSKVDPITNYQNLVDGLVNAEAVQQTLPTRTLPALSSPRRLASTTNETLATNNTRVSPRPEQSNSSVGQGALGNNPNVARSLENTTPKSSSEHITSQSMDTESQSPRPRPALSTPGSRSIRATDVTGGVNEKADRQSGSRLSKASDTPQNLVSRNSPIGIPTTFDASASTENRPLDSSFATPAVKLPWRNQLPASFTPLPTRLFGNITTPASLNERRRLLGMSPIDTSYSSTKWKALPQNTSKEVQSPPRPGNSPYLSDSPTSESESRTADHQLSVETTRGTDTPTKGRKRGGQRGRGNGDKIHNKSANPTAASAGIRSQSTLSTADDSAPESAIKEGEPELPGTPNFGNETVSLTSTPGESRFNARKRDLPPDSGTPKPVLKRKRVDTTDGTPDVVSVPRYSRPGQVLASRNFARIVSALLNDINSHKLASVFAKPITEKSAPGYQSLIHRPQDLKSIRSAISVGSRFVATIPDPGVKNEDVAEGDTPTAATPSTPTTKATNIWVERTAEIIPPKGIVNSAQLEKELCRMLANAVMYNPDPKRGFGPHFPMRSAQEPEDDDAAEVQEKNDMDEGRLVSDAREMFASVEQAVAAWRAAERVRPGEVIGKSATAEKVEDSNEDAAENTGGEDGEADKSALRRSMRG